MIARLIRDTTGSQCKQTSETRQTFRAKQLPVIIHKHYWGRLTLFHGDTTAKCTQTFWKLHSPFGIIDGRKFD